MILDDNIRVQEAGCSAFATFEEIAGSRLFPYLQQISRNLVLALEKYHLNNTLILYDAIGTLADSIRPVSQNVDALIPLIPPLLDHWSKLGNDHGNLIPLLEVRLCSSKYCIF